ncbi:MAG: D-alanine--D-alanine ligase [bacterium]|nr:D-alanine--D-alanine ligase [bacterium]
MRKKDIKDLRIGVLAGGVSSEREISLISGRAVKKTLDELGLKNVFIDVDKNIASRLKQAKIDLAFLALHGPGGEDGTIQGLLEIMEIPYTGSGVLASAAGMDKIFTKQILVANKIKTPGFTILNAGVRNFAPLPKLPFVVKPSRQGSAVGVSIVFKKSEIEKALDSAFSFDENILIEEYVTGKEITVGILGDDALPVVEIVPKNKFYDFEAKYKKGMSEHIIPARLPADIYKKAQKIALNTHRILGCRDVSRLDMIYNPKKGLFVLEINTIPGMTSVSLLPDAARSAGIDFKEMIHRIVVMAGKRAGLI